MNTKQTLRHGLALATVVGALAAPTASAGPIDPALPGGSDGSGDRGTPDRFVVAPETSTSGEGFDWGDAGIGAGAAFALTAIGLGGALARGSRRQREERAATIR
jgi:hypothetical protein